MACQDSSQGSSENDAQAEDASEPRKPMLIMEKKTLEEAESQDEKVLIAVNNLFETYACLLSNDEMAEALYQESKERSAYDLNLDGPEVALVPEEEIETVWLSLALTTLDNETSKEALLARTKKIEKDAEIQQLKGVTTELQSEEGETERSSEEDQKCLQELACQDSSQGSSENHAQAEDASEPLKPMLIMEKKTLEEAESQDEKVLIAVNNLFETYACLLSNDEMAEALYHESKERSAYDLNLDGPEVALVPEEEIETVWLSLALTTLDNETSKEALLARTKKIEKDAEIQQLKGVTTALRSEEGETERSSEEDQKCLQEQTPSLTAEKALELSNELDRLRSIITARESEQKAMSAQLKSLQAESDKQSGRVKLLSKMNDEANDKINSLRSKNQEQNETIAALRFRETERLTAISDLERSSEQNENRFQAHADQIASLRAENGHLCMRERLLLTEKRELESTINSLLLKSLEQNETIVGLRLREKKHLATISDLERSSEQNEIRFQAQADEVASLRVENGHLCMREGLLLTEKGELEGRINTLQSKNLEQNETIVALQSREKEHLKTISDLSAAASEEKMETGGNKPQFQDQESRKDNIGCLQSGEMEDLQDEIQLQAPNSPSSATANMSSGKKKKKKKKKMGIYVYETTDGGVAETLVCRMSQSKNQDSSGSDHSVSEPEESPVHEDDANNTGNWKKPLIAAATCVGLAAGAFLGYNSASLFSALNPF